MQMPAPDAGVIARREIIAARLRTALADQAAVITDPAETRAYVTTLAPIVGGGELAGPVVVAAADPLAWTRAPLFVVQSAGSGPAAPVQSEGEPDATTAAAPERDQGPVASRTDGLFVARNVPGGPR